MSCSEEGSTLGGFALIVVLIILLIIVGASFGYQL
ncbi:YjcZ family sporulation protein [Pullulanibacillus sp. KACC 23026]|nr:YjcZ family sporulation protein [Pullulanibacillus sp. KACC 23026]WEG14969.1 YjcZ family sporulation protein [Pullulanibacillus sp. KACC 23026]